MISRWVIVDRSPGQPELKITRPLFTTKVGAEEFKKSLESRMPTFTLEVKKVRGKPNDFQ
jgi:hypothetical protein